jgi:hypothetical protein
VITFKNFVIEGDVISINFKKKKSTSPPSKTGEVVDSGIKNKRTKTPEQLQNHKDYVVKHVVNFATTAARKRVMRDFHFRRGNDDKGYASDKERGEAESNIRDMMRSLPSMEDMKDVHKRVVKRLGFASDAHIHYDNAMAHHRDTEEATLDDVKEEGGAGDVGTKKLRKRYEKDTPGENPCWDGYKQIGMKNKKGRKVPNCIPEEFIFEVLKKHQNPEGGLNQSGRNYYKSKGHNLKAPVSSSEAKKSPRKAARRKSFCARMSGVKGPMKDEKGRPTRKALALRKWDCS